MAREHTFMSRLRLLCHQRGRRCYVRALGLVFGLLLSLTASLRAQTLQGEVVDDRGRTIHFDAKPQRVYEEMCRAFGPETRYVTTIGLSQIAAAQMLHVFRPRHWVNAGQAGPLGWTIPAAIGACGAHPDPPAERDHLQMAVLETAP